MRATPETLNFTGSDTKVGFAAPCFLHGFMLGMDGSNDPTVVMYNCGTSTTVGKTVIVPSNTYDSGALNLNGAMATERVYCSEGIAVEVTLSAGACDVTLLYSSRPVWCTG